MSGTNERISASLAAELSRQYDIVRELGRGGMGVVWLARERSLDRLVAIKVLSGDDVDVSHVRERFRREARIAARLVHPNIVPLHAFGETADALYFVMGYVEGETLAARLEREGRLDRQVAVRVLGEIADALAFAHREGVVHRDVKPENILLDAKSGRALLADFGIARIEGVGTSVTATGAALGTPSYMSPEQAFGSPQVDGRSDQYALGVVGYRMLMGRLPFSAGSVQALMAQHAMANPDDLTLAVAPGDRLIAQVIMRALEKDPMARWARAEHFRDVLRAAATDAVALPEALDRIDGVGTKMLLPLVLFTEVMYALSLSTRSPEIGVPFAIGFAGFLAALAAVRALPAARAFGWRETIRTLLRPPTRWAAWWPRALRGVDDIWDRLPASVRRFRAWRDSTIGLLAAHILVVMPTIVTDALPRSLHPYVLGAVMTGLAIGSVGTIVADRVARRALRGLGLTRYEAAKVGELPNRGSDAAWKNPQFAQLLAADGEVVPVRAPRTPAELVHAIEDIGEALRRSGWLPDDESARAARAVLAAIEELDAEIRHLHQEMDPAEGERLQRRLAALRKDGDDELRQLLENQREVLHRLEQRRHEKESRRDRLRDQLVTLWMQLLEMDARAARGAQTDPELTGRVRALSRELARAGEALVEVEKVLVSPTAQPRVTSLP